MKMSPALIEEADQRVHDARDQALSVARGCPCPPVPVEGQLHRVPRRRV